MEELTEFLEDYSKQAMTTAIYPQVGSNYNYPAKGLVDEWGEVAQMIWGYTPPFTQDQLSKEIGDGFWYANCLSVELGFNFPDIVNEAANLYIIHNGEQDLMQRGYVHLSQLAGHLKKYERDGGNERIVNTQSCLVNTVGMLMGVMNVYGIDLVTVLQMNIDKLFSRQERGMLGGDGDER